jgi:hypothetical protein
VQLALSLHHVQEIAQLSDRASVERRLKVLELFPAVRCKPAGSNHVTKLEIQLQLFALLGFKLDVRQMSDDTLFPAADLEDLRAATLDMQPLFKLMRRAHEMSADASNTLKQAGQGRPAMSMRRAVDPALLEAEAAEEAFRAALNDVAPDAQTLMRQMFQQVRTAIQSHGSVRRAMENIYKLSGVEIVDRIPDADLAAVSVFFESAREEAQDVLSRVQADPALGEQLVRRLDPYAGPGFALQLAVQRARMRHPKPDNPGDEIDVAHAGFAPYVDLLFADKRTYGFVAQEARDSPDLLTQSGWRTIGRAGTLERAAAMIAVRSADIAQY